MRTKVKDTSIPISGKMHRPNKRRSFASSKGTKQSIWKKLNIRIPLNATLLLLFTILLESTKIMIYDMSVYSNQKPTLTPTQEETYPDQVLPVQPPAQERIDPNQVPMEHIQGKELSLNQIPGENARFQTIPWIAMYLSSKTIASSLNSWWIGRLFSLADSIVWALILSWVVSIAFSSFNLGKLFKWSHPHPRWIRSHLRSLSAVTIRHPELKAQHIEKCGNMDSLIYPPLDYSFENLTGFHAPKFDPNSCYITELHEPDTECIIAITQRPLSMWIDPALSYYLANTGLFALKEWINKNIENGDGHFSKKVEINDTTEEFEEGKIKLLQQLSQLSEDAPIVNDICPIVRFFILDNNCLERYGNDYLASLYSLHELYALPAYFVMSDIKESGFQGEPNYEEALHALWEGFIDKWKKDERNIRQYGKKLEKIAKIELEKRKDEGAEFLFVSKADGTLRIRTYWKGKDECITIMQQNQIRNHCLNMIKIISTYSMHNSNLWTPPYDPTIKLKMINLV